MTAPSLTYTLTNGTTADASQVMQNFNDLLNGVTDGTKDLSISALTVAGTATLNGHVNLGNSSADDLTVTASLASNLPIKTNNTYAIGSATLGLSSLALGNGGAGLTCRILSASHATTRDYTVPDVGAAASFVMTGLAQTISQVKTFADGIKVDDDASQDTLNYYREEDHATTFTWNGTGSPGTSASVTIKITRIGRMVHLKIPATTATSGTTSTLLSSNTDLPAWASPPDSPAFPIYIVNNGSVEEVGAFNIQSTGNMICLRADAIAFSNSTTCGWSSTAHVVYSVE